jgi:hypothetical protein
MHLVDQIKSEFREFKEEDQRKLVHDYLKDKMKQNLSLRFGPVVKNMTAGGILGSGAGGLFAHMVSSSNIYTGIFLGGILGVSVGYSGPLGEEEKQQVEQARLDSRAYAVVCGALGIIPKKLEELRVESYDRLREQQREEGLEQREHGGLRRRHRRT